MCGVRGVRGPRRPELRGPGRCRGPRDLGNVREEGWCRGVPWPPGFQFSHLHSQGVVKAPVSVQILWVVDTDSACLTQQKSSFCRKGVFCAMGGGGAGSGRTGTRAAMGTRAAGGGRLVLTPLTLVPPAPKSWHHYASVSISWGAESSAQPPRCLSWGRVGTTGCDPSGSAPVRGGYFQKEGATEHQRPRCGSCRLKHAVLKRVHLSSYGRKPGQPGARSPCSQLTPGS